MSHPDDYGRPRGRNRFGIVDMNDPPPAPRFLTERRDRALQKVEAELTNFVETANREITVPQSDYQPTDDPIMMVKRLLAALPTLKSIEAAEGILKAGDFKDKIPASVDLAVAMAKWGGEA